MLTLSKFKQSRALRIAGVCTSSPEFAQIANDAERELLKRGNFWNSVKRLTMCVYSGCIVWPRQVETVLALDKCGHSIPPVNHWFSFHSLLAEDIHGCGGAWDGRCRSPWGLEDLNTTPVFNQPPCLNDRYVQFYPTRPEDVGKVITLYGIDSGGNVIRSIHADGTYDVGIEMTLALPFVQSPMLIRRVDRSIKAVTAGTVYGYWFDGATRYDMAVYEPGETLPEYRNTKIAGCWNTGAQTGCCPSQIRALVKLKHIDVVVDNDVFVLDDEDAMSLAVQALKKQDSYESQDAEVLWSQSIHTLNLQLRNLMPDDQIPRRVQTQGSARLSRLRIGRLM